ncbi:MAG: alpha/beta hydrolase [Pirellulaceae bacterium]
MTKLNGDAGEWHRWATAAVLNWSPSTDADRIPLFRIHGDRDTTFPIRYTNADIVIRGGGHVLPVTHHEEVAEALRRISGVVLE